jgi:hypothetical protein
MLIPTIEQCHELFEQYKVPGTVQTHCQTVFKVATYLAEELKKKGYPINTTIIGPLALLHDFMKAVTLEKLDNPPYNYNPSKEELEMHQKLREQYPDMSETKVTSFILQDKYPEFSQLFLELDKLTHEPHPRVSEEAHFIHYVDWRVLGNKVVPIEQRMNYILERYGSWIKKRNLDWEQIKKEQLDYQQKIFKHLPIQPEELSTKIIL